MLLTLGTVLALPTPRSGGDAGGHSALLKIFPVAGMRRLRAGSVPPTATRSLLFAINGGNIPLTGNSVSYTWKSPRERFLTAINCGFDRSGPVLTVGGPTGPGFCLIHLRMISSAGAKTLQKSLFFVLSFNPGGGGGMIAARRLKSAGLSLYFLPSSENTKFQISFFYGKYWEKSDINPCVVNIRVHWCQNNGPLPLSSCI